MNFGILFIIDFVIVVVFEIAFENIRNFRLYQYIIDSNKYFLYERMEKREKLVYIITKMVWFIPKITFASQPYEIDRVGGALDEKERRIAKRYAKMHYSWCFLGFAVKAILLTLLIEFRSNIWEICKNVFFFVKKIDLMKGVMDVIKWINENIAFVFVILFIVLSCYYLHLAKKKNKFSIEKTWKSDEDKKLEKIASLQYDMEHELLTIRSKIYENICLCKRLAISLKVQGSVEEKELDQLVSYADHMTRIKEILSELVEMDAWVEWGTRNQKVYLQLGLLGLLPSPTKSYGFVEIEKCNDKYIKRQGLSLDIFISTWSHGIAFINGIERIILFSNKRFRTYKRLVDRLNRTKILKDDLSNIKE